MLEDPLPGFFSKGSGSPRQGDGWECLAVFGAVDLEAQARGYRFVGGVDEVGRGALAGPVVAAAVVLAPGTELPGLADSKRVTAAARAVLVPRIRSCALALGLGEASAEEIDRLNILKASLTAMARAIEALGTRPDFLLVDGLHPVPIELPQRPFPKADALSSCVAAASNVAKEHRDALMTAYATRYPGYGFEENAGYATAAHLAAVKRLGPSPIHRKTFQGVREYYAPGLFDER